MRLFGTFFAAVFGLILGSFFNVLIHRLPHGESIVWPGSRCPHCGRSIRWYENIPVVSYFILCGKCAGCGLKISLQYPLVELGTAVLTALLWQTEWIPFLAESHVFWEWIAPLLRTASLLVLVPVAVIDLKHYIIPDTITLSGLVVSILASLAPGGISPLQAGLGVVAGGGFLLLTGLIGEWLLRRQDAMGGGDIKLMAFLGAVWGPTAAFLGIVLGSLLGAVIGLGLLAFKALRDDHRLPFGPFLACGVWIAALSGDRILSFYFTLTEQLLQHI
ncbi:MAG: prepilin peptidase [Chitinivibrionales bacterium]|nr:prepilin peptidase [Chitinivibrionales bacterium]MBD3357532.1 prepilin peptidase [Chitinivibrionales bacterium]